MTPLRAILAAAALLLAPTGARATCADHMATSAVAVSATDTAGLPKSRIAIGRPTDVKLVPVATIRFPARPEKTGGPYAGLLAFDMTHAGSVRVALGARAWLDMVDGQGTIASVAHSHGAACSGVAKEVTFPLTSGPHVIEITASAAPSVAILLTPTD